jgi:hypothetical protein
MNMHLLRWMLLTALFTATGFLATSQAATAPVSLVGRQLSLIDTNGSLITMRFLAANRYEKATSLTNETGFFTAKRTTTNSWKVATTKSDGTETIQYTLVYTSAESGTFTAEMAGSRVTGPFSEARIPTGGILSMTIQNEASQTGPSTYTIQFSGGTSGTFNIIPPLGFGSGNFTYTPGTNSAQLVLTFTGELLGDVDDLILEFHGASGSLIPSRHSGTQTISGQVYPVEGTFTFVTQ